MNLNQRLAVEALKNDTKIYYGWGNEHKTYDEAICFIPYLETVLNLLEKTTEKSKKQNEKIKAQQKELSIAYKKILSQKGQLKIFNRDFINKSKIDEKIKELESKKDLIDNDSYTFKEAIEGTITTLKELKGEK